jgi:hypothetical protein
METHVMNPTTNIDRELTEAELAPSREMTEAELERVSAGLFFKFDLVTTTKISSEGKTPPTW